MSNCLIPMKRTEYYFNHPIKGYPVILRHEFPVDGEGRVWLFWDNEDQTPIFLVQYCEHSGGMSNALSKLSPWEGLTFVEDSNSEPIPKSLI